MVVIDIIVQRKQLMHEEMNTLTLNSENNFDIDDIP